MLRTLFFILSSAIFCNATSIDSLERKLSVLVSQEDKLDLYNQLVEGYWHTDTRKAMIYSDSAYALALKLKLKTSAKVQALANKGISAYTLGDYSKALLFYDSAMKLGYDIKCNVDNVFIYYLNLLKKQSKFHEVIFLVDSALNKSKLSKNFSEQLILIKANAYVESGNAVEGNAILNQIDYKNASLIKQASILIIQSALESIRGDYKMALKHLDKSLSIYRYEGDSLNMAKVKLEKGKIYINYGIFDSARLVLDESLKLYKRANYPYGIAKCQYWLGSMYTELGEGTIAADYYYKALRVFEEQSNIKEIAETYNDFAWMYSKDDTKKSMELINKSIMLAHSIGDIGVEATGYNFKGVFFDRMQNYDSAIWAYDKSSRLRRSINYTKGEAAAEFNKAVVFEKIGQYQKALEIYLRTYRIELALGNKLGSAISEYTIGGVLTKLKRYSEVKPYLDLALNHLNQIEARAYMVECFDEYAKYYEAIGDNKNALLFFKKKTNLKDSVNGKEKDNRLAELETRYALEKKEKEINLLSLENENRRQSQELQQKTIANQRILIGFISTGILSVIALLIVVYRLLQIKNRSNKKLLALNREISEQAEEITAQSEELREANEEILSLNEGLEEKVNVRTKELKKATKELDTFFYHASHDFRRPLTTFFGLAEIANTILDDPKALELFEKVGETAGSLDRMVSKLKAISIIGFEKVEYTTVDFNELIGRILIRHKAIIQEHSMAVKINTELNQYRTSYNLFEIIVDNLIENAILYSRTTVDSYLNVNLKLTDKKLVLEIIDNGQGIEESLIPNIFDMYYRANEGSKGNGLGLYIAKKATEKLDGKIVLSTKYGEGTTFTITLPEKSK